MNFKAFPICWIERTEPLRPMVARVPRDEAILLLEGAPLEGIHALVTKDAIVLSGSEECLPWTPSIRYFGRDVAAPSLYVPTDRMPNIPYELFERCVRRKFTFAGPLLVDAVGHRILGMLAERPLERALLLEYVQGRDSWN